MLYELPVHDIPLLPAHHKVLMQMEPLDLVMLGVFATLERQCKAFRYRTSQITRGPNKG